MKKVIRTPDYPIVKTKQGKLHGYQEDDVFHFYGIRYGTAKRFELPEAEKPWNGVRDAKAYGYICPLMPEPPAREDDPMAAPGNSFEMPHVYWPMSEQCLYLNVWTKHIEKDAKKPVMVWLHGGGYAAGSSVEIPAYNGHNLSDYGDVVIVNLNHRLNCIGFLDLSSYGEKYKYSGCAGMADIVLALQWVKENIAAFGGDPQNVTVAGQSGGGGKAVTLLQMPVADGLYQKVISQSGALRNRPDSNVEQEKAHWQELGKKTVEMLGLKEDTIDQICEMDYDTLAAAAVKAGKELGLQGGMMLYEPSPVEGFYTGPATVVGFREETKEIPIMAGTMLGEFSFMHYLGDKSKYMETEKLNILEQTYGERTMAVVNQFRAIYPKLDILYALSVDTLFRIPAISFLNKRISFTNKPCYNYMMDFIIPYMGGLVPWHCGDIPFVFRNVEMEPAQCTGYEYTEKLQNQVSDAWIAFMQTGNPSTDELMWKPYRKDDPCRMKFAEECGMEEKDDSELLRLVAKSFYM
ncbi:MAG: carboxylesterase family protein [Hespellia sp.]|nr:carboxylesterase family protein [Hespellia sp.]